MKPFLKWAGGKRWLVRRHPELFPANCARYVEPFVGSGAVFFHLAPARSILSDLNGALINLYDCLKKDPDRIHRLLAAHAKQHGKRYYYVVRGTEFREPFAKAAQFLYLNRTCWNGLYRENLRGEFNVPKGTKDAVLFDDDDFEAAAAMLKKATLVCSDFEPIIEKTRDGDFVFIDPPYTVKHNVNGFVKYNESIFSWADQVRLATALKKKSACGASYLVTNAFHPSILELYEDFATITPVSRASVLSGDSQYRGEVQEALISIGRGPLSRGIEHGAPQRSRNGNVRSS